MPGKQDVHSAEANHMRLKVVEMLKMKKQELAQAPPVTFSKILMKASSMNATYKRIKAVYESLDVNGDGFVLAECACMPHNGHRSLDLGELQEMIDRLDIGNEVFTSASLILICGFGNVIQSALGLDSGPQVCLRAMRCGPRWHNLTKGVRCDAEFTLPSPRSADAVKLATRDHRAYQVHALGPFNSADPLLIAKIPPMSRWTIYRSASSRHAPTQSRR